MAKAKAATTNENPQNSIQVLKEATCPSASGKSTLGYQLGITESGEPQLCIVSNSGGGFATFGEWIPYSAIDKALKAWPEDQAITSMALRSLSRGKSANNAGFLCAVLVAEGLLEPVPGKARVHQLADPSAFLASISRGATKKRSAKPKAKATPKAKAKAAPKAKTPRKTK